MNNICEVKMGDRIHEAIVDTRFRSTETPSGRGQPVACRIVEMVRKTI